MTTCLPSQAKSSPGHVGRIDRPYWAAQRSLVGLTKSVLFLKHPVQLTDRLVAGLTSITTLMAGLVVGMTVVALFLRLAQHAAILHPLLG